MFGVVGLQAGAAGRGRSARFLTGEAARPRRRLPVGGGWLPAGGQRTAVVPRRLVVGGEAAAAGGSSLGGRHVCWRGQLVLRDSTLRLKRPLTKHRPALFCTSSQRPLPAKPFDRYSLAVRRLDEAEPVGSTMACYWVRMAFALQSTDTVGRLVVQEGLCYGDSGQ